MARAGLADDARPATRQDLVRWILGGARPAGSQRVGMEVERILLAPHPQPLSRGERGGYRRLAYDADGACIRALLERLRAAGPHRKPVLEDGRIVGVEIPDGGSYQLEPGGQIEWASPPADGLTDLLRREEAYEAELGRETDALGIRLLDRGADPETPMGEVPWVPKHRYALMREYLPGGRATFMMAQTASVQVSVDHGGEADLALKFRAASAIAPLVNAIFSNAPRDGLRSARYASWRDTDPARCGLCPLAFDPAFTAEGYVLHCLRIPMMVRRGLRGRLVIDRRPFEAALDEGLDGRPATLADWDLHLAGIFFDVRLRRYVECRSADYPPAGEVGAVVALWTGALRAAGAVLDLLPGLEHAEAESLATAVAERGLDAAFRGRPLADHARALLAVARSALGDDARWLALLERRL